MNIIVKEELRVYIDPLTPEEHDALERSILSEGCRDALRCGARCWGMGTIATAFVRSTTSSFQTVQNPRFQSMDDVHLWDDRSAFGAAACLISSVALALRKRNSDGAAASQGRGNLVGAGPGHAGGNRSPLGGRRDPWSGGCSPGSLCPRLTPLASARAIARRRVSAAPRSARIENPETAAPELVEAVKSGDFHQCRGRGGGICRWRIRWRPWPGARKNSAGCASGTRIQVAATLRRPRRRGAIRLQRSSWRAPRCRRRNWPPCVIGAGSWRRKRRIAARLQSIEAQA